MLQQIIVVDDDPLVLDMTCMMVESFGLRCRGFQRAVDAIAALGASDPVHLVITDVVMPDISGIDVYEAARRRDPLLPVIYMSGFIPPALLQRMRFDIHTSLFLKPFAVDQLRQEIKRLLSDGAQSIEFTERVSN